MVWGHNQFHLAMTEKNKQWVCWQRQNLSPRQLLCNKLKEMPASPTERTGKQLSNEVLSPFLHISPIKKKSLIFFQ